MKFIDSHCHYLSGRFSKDRYDIIGNLLNTDLKYLIECGTNTKSNIDVLKLCEKYSDIYGVIGYFPLNVQELENNKILNNFCNLLTHDKVLGLGEIGLDYYHKGDIELQKKWFIEQLKIAKQFDLPVCIHSRDAEKDTLNILKNNGKYKGVMHCYSYGIKTMKELVKLGYYFGIGGTCTYSQNKELRAAIQSMPLDRIVLETDAPYLSPIQVKRSRNDSSNIKYVISEISKIKGVSEKNIISQTNENIKSLYPKINNF